jgi:hypothetical protein
MQKALAREERLYLRRVKGRTPDLADGWAFITYLNLYFATTHVLVEAWDKALFYDADVADLLDDGFRQRLRRFRNAVFHANPLSDDRVKDVYTRFEHTRPVADRLLDAVTRFVKRELAVRRIAFVRPPI